MSKNKDGLEIEVLSSTKSTRTTTKLSDIKKDIKEHFDNVQKVNQKASDKAQQVVDRKKEANRLVSMANKRLRRLEQNGLQNTPAYQGFLANGGQYFSVRGLTQAELQRELQRLKGFIDAQTSTVRGTNQYAKEMAKNTGIKYKNLTELRKITPKFFELSSKIEQYLRTVEDMAAAIDYNQIWESINVYVKEQKIDLTQAQGDIDGMIKNVSQAIAKFDDRMSVKGTSFRLKK